MNAQDNWLKAEALYENAIVRLHKANQEMKDASSYFHKMQDELVKAREALIQDRLKENVGVEE